MTTQSNSSCFRFENSSDEIYTHVGGGSVSRFFFFNYEFTHFKGGYLEYIFKSAAVEVIYSIAYFGANNLLFV